jgi:anti-sigma regulatory factor (Ser/Thr protein kinase)
MAVANAVEGWCAEIPGGVEAAWTAREILTNRLGKAAREDTLHDLHLLTTELVTNAVLHAGVGEAGTIELRVAAERNRVRVAVTDPGGEDTPVVQDLDPEVPGGMGLFLVEQISSSWGVERAPGGGNRVWFELAA